MLFVATGGTFDKLPVYLADGMTFDHDSKEFGETHLPEMLEKAHFVGERVLRTLFMLDSLDINEGHRSLLRIALEGTEHEQIVVTHGTDTMADTALALTTSEELTAKTVVLTGAMEPYSMGEISDAMFNLGNAIAYAKTLPAGIYVAMDGQAFDADNVYKDLEARVFKAVR
jgi:L-asparaginase